MFDRPHGRASRYWTFDMMNTRRKARAEMAEANGHELKGQEEEGGNSGASKWLR
jgi:hypothetical protein